MKKTEWLKIEKEFIEWDTEGGFNFSQRQIMDWFKIKFNDRTSKLEELVGLYEELRPMVHKVCGVSEEEIIRADHLRQKISELRKELGLT